METATRDLWLQETLAMVRRRKWIILQALLVIPLVALALSLHQDHLYRASSQVVLNQGDLAASVTGLAPGLIQPSDRATATQAAVARVSELALRVLGAAGLPGRSPQWLLDRSEVSAKREVDLLQFSVTVGSGVLAERLADTYAREYTKYRHDLDLGSLERARRQVQERIDRLRDSGQTDTPLFRDLVETERRLGTAMVVGVSSGLIVRRSEPAALVQPRPLRNALLGVGLGLILGLGLAFARDALDTRLRSADEVGERLGLPLLGTLPAPPRRLQKDNKLVMLADPGDPSAEAFRQLRTNFAFANLARGAKVVMVTSALEKEGKTTTAANLALALARAGQNVTLVDLDLRGPSLAIGGSRRRPGLTDVALGTATLDDALLEIPIHSPPENGSGRTTGSGRVMVLPAGTIPPDPGEFVGGEALAGLLDQLRARFDLVILDTPPVLRVGDAMALSARADALIIITRLHTLRRPALMTLKRQLDSSPAMKLGYVITGGEDTAGDYGYGRYGWATAESDPVPAR